jgi:hypothetical protein
MRCERCFSHVVQAEDEGPCIIEQVDDNEDFLTLVVEADGNRQTYILSDEAIEPLLGESWESVLESIAPYQLKE